MRPLRLITSVVTPAGFEGVLSEEPARSGVLCWRAMPKGDVALSLLFVNGRTAVVCPEHRLGTRAHEPVQCTSDHRYMALITSCGLGLSRGDEQRPCQCDPRGQRVPVHHAE